MAESPHQMNRLPLILCCCLALFASCVKAGDIVYVPNPNEEKADGAPMVVVLYGPNDLGDRSYCDLIYRGVETAAQRYGLRTLQLSPESEEQGRAYLEKIFSQMEDVTDTVRRLFITPSSVYNDYIRANNRRLEVNPRADLLYMETTTPLEGKGSTLYIDYYGAMYMGGCLAHYTDKTAASLILANPYTQAVREAAEGFAAGVNDTPRSPMPLHARYLSDEPAGGFAVADSTMLRILNEDEYFSDSIYIPICGGSIHSLIRAMRAFIWITFGYVGVDGDLNADRYCYFSIIKNIDRVMEDYVGLWLDGDLPKHQTLGLKEGSTGVVINGAKVKVKLDLDSLRRVAILKEKEYENR